MAGGPDIFSNPIVPSLPPSLLSWHLITFQCPVQLSVHTRPTLAFINHRQQIWHRGVTSPGAGDRGLRANQRRPFGRVTNERRGNTQPWLTMESSHYSRTQLNIVCLKKYESAHWIRIIKHQGGERQRPTLLFSAMKERERKTWIGSNGLSVSWRLKLHCLVSPPLCFSSPRVSFIF